MKQAHQNPQSKIRNFSIIAHIDHGKSTLADRLLEKTKTYTLNKSKQEERVLDRLELEQEKGITIKLQAARMQWKKHQLNLIDTPGHVDFSYEVSRSLAACEGALLLIDAKQGIQAQTISTTKKALALGLKILPVINKIDLPNVDIEAKVNEIHDLLGFTEDEIIKISAKDGTNITQLLDEIINRLPSPLKQTRIKPKDIDTNTKALIFDSFYDEHKGVIIAIRIFSGSLDLNKTETLYMLQKERSFKPTEIGFFTPTMTKTKKLATGEVGYLATGLKDIKYFAVGDTVSDSETATAVPGYKTPKPNVFATFFPTDPNGFKLLKIGLNKLALNDAALQFSAQKSNLLGSGFRCGFLGLLHMEIIQERLEREHNVEMIITAPTVQYEITLTNGSELVIHTPQELPETTKIKEIREPWVRMKILCPQEYMGVIMDLCQVKRGDYVTTSILNKNSNSKKRTLNMQYLSIEYDIPLSSLISNFFDQMKSLSSGYASMEYEFIDFFPVALIKVAILVNHEEIPALSFLDIRDTARNKATKILAIMKDEIPRQQFPVPLQAAINGKIIARKDVKAVRKNVTAKLYGGDYSRKKKLLEKQKKGKKRLKQIGSVSIPQEAFMAILKT